MGLLHLHQKDLTGAAPWFAKAAQLDSKSYLTHYYAAMMDVQRGSMGEAAGMKDASARMEASLQRAIQLNPNFAPAYSLLATVYMFREDKLEEALKAAQQAARLEPGEIHLHINVANILMRMKRVDEAILLGQTVLAASKDAQQRGAATRFLQNAVEYKESLARYEAMRRAEEERAARRAEELRKLEAEAEAARDAPPPENYLDPTGQQGVARGTITMVSCAQPAVLNVTLQLRQNALKFRAANRAQVAYYSEKARAVRKFDPCTQLRNVTAEVTYRPVSGRAYTGEILAIEMLPEKPAGSPVKETNASSSVLAARAGETVTVRSAESTAAAAPSPAAAAASPSLDVSQGVTGWAEGRILAASCKGNALSITIDLSGGFLLKLRAEDYQRVNFFSGPEWQAPPDFKPCAHLLRRVVEVGYRSVQDQAHDGEMVTVKLLR
jgi:tetratricopeptide (TPR) repeat protein